MIDRIEALVDSIARLRGSHDPSSTAYKLRNPLLLKSYAMIGRHQVDVETGYRVFDSFLGGYKSATYDITLKLKGLSRAGLKTTDKLKNLLGVYNIHEKAAIDNVVAFLRRALDRQDISSETELSFFLEDKDAR